MTKSLKSGGKSEGDMNKRNTLKVGGDGGSLKKGLEQHRSQEDIYSAPQISKKGEKRRSVLMLLSKIFLFA